MRDRFEGRASVERNLAVLERRQDGAVFVLHGHNVVGRSRQCDVFVDSRSVSREHASLWWDGEKWWLKDLGSSNGTFLEGRRVETGVPHALVSGAEIGFGTARNAFVVVAGGPPRARAVCLEDGREVAEFHDLLVFPDGDHPVWTVFEEGGRWVAESGDDKRTVEDRATFVIDGLAWRLYLPEGVPVTMGVSLGDGPGQQGLKFEVSRDQEHVRAWLEVPGLEPISLGTRAHLHTLLHLARARLEDAAANPEISVSEQGWRYADEVASLLRIDEGTLNVHIYRARQQVGELRLGNAPGIIERRVQPRQVRIGLSDLVVVGG